jgi:hypothetical protein
MRKRSREKPHSTFIDLTGQRFGRWTVISRSENFRRVVDGIVVCSNARWLCKCDCGGERIVGSYVLIRGDSKSCGCLQKENGSKTGKEYCGEKHPNYKKDRNVVGIARILNHYKHSSKGRGISFDLTREELGKIIQEPCYYCGELPSNMSPDANKKGVFMYNGIDRVDSSLGYVITNCVPCCKRCNKAKLSMPRSEFFYWIKRVYEYNFGSNL